jgi:uncharacterized protein YndB with AHSA1/START domain
MTTTTNRKGSATVALPSDTEIVITRVFDAPASLLFKAYTTPELVRQWWGYSEDVWLACEVDLRVGGAWRWVTQHTNESGSFEVAFHGVYREIDAPTRLVYTEVFEGAPVSDPDALAAVNTIVFAEVDGVTTMTNTCVCPDQFVRDTIIESGMEHGMQISMDRLEETASTLAD